MDSLNELETLKLIIRDRRPKKGKELIRIAEQMKNLKDKLGAKRLSEELGVSYSIISDFVRIAKLDSETKELIANSELGLKAITMLLTLENKDVQRIILSASAKLRFTESEIRKIVSCCKRGENVENCIGSVLKEKPRHEYVIVSRLLPDDLISRIVDVNLVKEAIRKHIGIEVDHVMVRGNRVEIYMKSGAYSKFIEKAALSGVDEFDLIHEILKKEFLKLT
jgi:hypothetical protein